MIEVKGLNINFSGKKIINNLNFHVGDGAKIVLKGPSGSGKSSVLMSVLGFVKPASGSIKIDNLPLNNSTIRQIRSITAWVPQELSLNISTTGELLLLPFKFKINKPFFPSKESINQMLANFGLKPEILDEKLNNISGGEKQRISLCSSLLQNKKLIVLDEPTSALDYASKKTVTEIFKNNANLTVLSASHDDYWIKHNDFIIDLKNYNN